MESYRTLWTPKTSDCSEPSETGVPNSTPWFSDQKSANFVSAAARSLLTLFTIFNWFNWLKEWLKEPFKERKECKRHWKRLWKSLGPGRICEKPWNLGSFHAPRSSPAHSHVLQSGPAFIAKNMSLASASRLIGFSCSQLTNSMLYSYVPMSIRTISNHISIYMLYTYCYFFSFFFFLKKKERKKQEKNKSYFCFMTFHDIF